MPVWTWEELVMLWRKCYSQRSADDVLFLYIRWGGVVRWVLEHANEPQHLAMLDTAVEAMNTEELKKACRGDRDDRVCMLKVLLTKLWKACYLCLAPIALWSANQALSFSMTVSYHCHQQDERSEIPVFWMSHVHPQFLSYSQLFLGKLQLLGDEELLTPMHLQSQYSV